MSIAPTVQRFGQQRELLGFLQVPANHTATGVIFLNAGLLSSMGPFRLFADCADQLNSLGFPTLRFDQSGKGDSSSRNTDRDEANRIDFEAVQSLMEPLGIKRYVLIGLCSGADDATQIAATFSSVEGLVLLDGYARRNSSHWRHHYLPRLVKVTPVFRALGRLLRPQANKKGPKPPAVSLRNWNSDEHMIERYQALLERGVAMLAVFTAGVGDYYNHVGQLASVLGTAEHLTEVFYQDAEHIYPSPAHRDRLIEQISSWLTSSTFA